MSTGLHDGLPLKQFEGDAAQKRRNAARAMQVCLHLVAERRRVAVCQHLQFVAGRLLKQHIKS